MLPYLVLLRVGFAVPRDVVLARGALLPHRFTLTTHPEGPFGGLLSVALSVGSRRPGVTWHSALWSPDFPRNACAPSDHPADSNAILARTALNRGRTNPEAQLQWVRVSLPPRVASPRC